MKIRIFLVILFVLTGLSPAWGADMTVAVLTSDGALPYEDVLAGFRAETRNRTMKMIILETGDDPKQLDGQISRHTPDVILCLGAKALTQASHIRDIPKVFALITYAGMQPWLNRQDVYGVTLDLALPSQLRSIRQAFPDKKRIGLLYSPEQNQIIIDEAKKYAPSLGFGIVAYPVRSIRDIHNIIKDMDQKIDLLLAIYDHTVYQPEAAKYILLQSLRKQIPFVGFSPQFAKAGAVLALYGDYGDMGRQAAGQAMAVMDQGENINRILRPRKVRTAINQKVAGAMRITFPPQFLKNIDQVY